MPLQVLSHPVHLPDFLGFNVGGLSNGYFCLFARVSKAWPDFEYLHALARDAISQVNLRPNMSRRSIFLQKFLKLPLAALYFKFTYGHDLNSMIALT